MKKLSLALATVLLLSGCAIHQRVTPVASIDAPEICVIENATVRQGFVEQLRNSLAGKGYQVRMVPVASPTGVCPVSVSYTASWRWDLALYMAYAEIKVYSNGMPAGEAIYDSTGGSGNPGKFIDASTKIRELVDQLFPAKAGA
jgi:hypothetical protein